MNPAKTTSAVQVEPLMDARQLSALLGVPLSWVYDNVALLPAFRIGRALRFRPSEVDGWLESQREGPVLSRRRNGQGAV